MWIECQIPKPPSDPPPEPVRPPEEPPIEPPPDFPPGPPHQPPPEPPPAARASGGIGRAATQSLALFYAVRRTGGLMTETVGLALPCQFRLMPFSIRKDSAAALASACESSKP